MQNTTLMIRGSVSVSMQYKCEPPPPKQIAFWSEAKSGKTRCRWTCGLGCDFCEYLGWEGRKSNGDMTQYNTQLTLASISCQKPFRYHSKLTRLIHF